MIETRLDLLIDGLQAELRGLSRNQFAAFFAANGERLFPLYVGFARKTGWGDPTVLSHALDGVWGYLAGGEPLNTRELIEGIEAVTPHGDEFDAPDSTYAQDSAACVDASLRAVDQSEAIDPRWVEMAIEPTKISLCHEQTGYLDLGSSDKNLDWENSVTQHPKMKAVIDFCRETISFVKSKNSFSAAEIGALRARAIAGQRDN